VQVAQVATAGFVVVMLFFAGLLIRYEDMPSELGGLRERSERMWGIVE
jgi:hypothetical protein